MLKLQLLTLLYTHLIIDHGNPSLKVIIGTDRGLDVSVETPLGNCDWEFFHHDETEEAK